VRSGDAEYGKLLVGANEHEVTNVKKNLISWISTGNGTLGVPLLHQSNKTGALASCMALVDCDQQRLTITKSGPMEITDSFRARRLDESTYGLG
jgi:hypothetical protein